MDELRQRQRSEVSIFDLHGHNNGQASDPALYAELEGLLAQLSDDEREVIVLKVIDVLTFQEIADLRGVSINTAASWYRRGLEKLKALWMEEVK